MRLPKGKRREEQEKGINLAEYVSGVYCGGGVVWPRRGNTAVEASIEDRWIAQKAKNSKTINGRGRKEKTMEEDSPI